MRKTAIFRSNYSDMKKLLLLIVTLISFGLKQGNAQTTLTQAVDFTVTDVNGDTWNLFDILNGGQHVCIDFFFTTCPPCIATSPYFKQTYSNFGCNNEDIFFIAVDVGDTDAEVLAYENSVLGGAPGYPSVSGLNGGGDAVVNDYGVGAFPTYILIAPNKTIVEQDMWPIASASTFTTFFGGHALSPIPCSTVGINEAEETALNVYPNPATDLVSVASEKPIDSYTVADLSGKIRISGAASRNNSSQRITFDVTALPAGVYVVEIKSGNAVSKSRLIKM